MTELRPIRKACALVVPILVISCVLAQTAADRIGPIAGALRNEDSAKALELLQPALKEFPGNDTLWTMQGVAYSKLWQKKEALASFRKALKIAPDSIPALQGACEAGYETGNPAAIPLLRHV